MKKVGALIREVYIHIALVALLLFTTTISYSGQQEGTLVIGNSRESFEECLRTSQEKKYSSIEVKYYDIGKEDLLKLFATYPNIERLKLSYCNLIANDVIQYLPKTLTALDISQCTQITDTGMQYLEGLKLTEVDLSGCNITHTALQYLSKDITALDLKGCDQIRESHLIDFTHLQTLGLPDGERLQGIKLQEFLGKLRKLDKKAKRILSSQLQTIEALDKQEISVAPSELPDLAFYGDKIRTLKLKQGELDGTSQHLSSFPNIRNLNLSNCSFAGRQLKLFSSLPLEALDLSGCDITDETLKLLGKIGWSLKRLSLRGCTKITDDGIQHLKRLKLTNLDLGECDITNQALRHLVEITTLTKLYLSNCPKITAEGIPYPRQLRLKVVDFSKSSVTNKALEQLAQAEMPLIELNLSKCHEITDDGIKYLRNIPLQILCLGGCSKITKMSLGYLPKTITILDLSKCHGISASNLFYLRNFPALRVLCSSSEGKYEKETLQEYLTEQLRKAELEAVPFLWGQNISIDNLSEKVVSATPTHLLTLSPLGKRVKALKLTEGSVSGFVDYIESFPHISKLYLCKHDIAHDELKGLRELKLKDLGLDLSGSLLTKNIAEQLQHLSHIKRLGVIKHDMTDQELEHLSGLSMDLRLDLSESKVTDDGLKRLLEMNLQITKLYLSNCHGITDKGVRFLKKLELTELDLSGCSITNEALKSLGKMRLAILYLNNCPKITDSGMECLQRLDLTEVGLSGCAITTLGLQYLPGDITVLDLRKCAHVEERDLYYLRNFTKLKACYLFENNKLVGKTLREYLTHLFNQAKSKAMASLIKYEINTHDLGEKVIGVAPSYLPILAPIGDQIQGLELINFCTVNDSMCLSMYLPYFPMVKHLSLAECGDITTKGLQCLAKMSLEKLEVREGADTTSSNLRFLVENCPTLQDVWQAGVKIAASELKTKIREAELNELLSQQGIQREELSSKLVTVTASQLSVLYDYRDKITAISLTSDYAPGTFQYLKEHFPNLHTLYLYNCVQARDMGLEVLGEITTLRRLYLINTDHDDEDFIPLEDIEDEAGLTDKNLIFLQDMQLEEVSLADSLITNEGLKHLSKMPLTYLNLSWCRNIKGRGLEVLPRSLTVLNLSYCYEVDDSSLEVLGGMEKLSTLNLQECSEVTFTGIHTLVTTCLSLEKLNICNCRRILSREVFSFIGQCNQICPNLRISFSP